MIFRVELFIEIKYEWLAAYEVFAAVFQFIALIDKYVESTVGDLLILKDSLQKFKLRVCPLMHLLSLLKLVVL